MDLIDRKYRILQAIIDDYILTALPVGSRTISRKYEQKLSSATIRNEMSDLEEMGLIVAVTIAVAVATLFIYARSVTTRSRSTFYSISACCAAGLLVIQMSLNVFGATDILPLTGVTFPFISSGGSSIISCWGLLAFVKAADERTYSLKVKS